LGGSTGDHPAFTSPRRLRAPLIAIGVLVALAFVPLLKSRSGDAGAGSVDSVKVIAVIPFTNVSADTEQDYFADGMADEVSTELGRLPGVSLASRTAAYRFKGPRYVDLHEVRRLLGVDAVVQGTVQRASGRWRVSVQLTSATTGVEIWSEHYDRDATDVFAVQDDIGASIARVILPRLIANDPASAKPGSAAPPVQGTRNATAYDLYLRGRHLLESRGPSARSPSWIARRRFRRPQQRPRTSCAPLRTAVVCRPSSVSCKFRCRLVPFTTRRSRCATLECGTGRMPLTPCRRPPKDASYSRSTWDLSTRSMTMSVGFRYSPRS